MISPTSNLEDLMLWPGWIRKTDVSKFNVTLQFVLDNATCFHVMSR